MQNSHRINADKLSETLKEYCFEDISSVTYHADLFRFGNQQLMFKHIDIDFINGEFLEINEDDKLYSKLKNIFSVKDTDSEGSQILYEKS